jgi:rhodanese-related sulfurtransferase
MAMAEIGNLSPQQLIDAEARGVKIIDIRTSPEWQQTGVIKSANKITFFNASGTPMVDSFMSEFQKIVSDKNQEFILVCRSGARTAAVANFLSEQLGYLNVSHLAHGMNSWLASNLPVEY